MKTKWLYRLDDDVVFDLKEYLPADWNQKCTFLDEEKNQRLVIEADGNARVLAHYAWNGCSPKFWFFDIVIGTPDGVPRPEDGKPKAYYASLIHDVLYQFLDCQLPLSRASADKVFLDILQRDEFAPRKLYYAAVRLCGGAVRWITYLKRSYESGTRECQ